MIETSLKRVLDELLLPKGFKRNSRGMPVYKKEVNGKPQEVGLRAGFTGGKDYAIYFNVPEEDTFYELSPICPLKNTYWWPQNLTQEHVNSLIHLIEFIVLGYFENRGNDELIKTRDVFISLLTDKNGFIEYEDCYWRTLDDFIQIVDTELLAAGTFSYIYASVWHKSLMRDDEEFHPKNVSRASSKLVGMDGVVDDAHSTIFSLFESDKMLNSNVIPHILNYFKNIKSIEDIRLSIKPEYKSYFNEIS